MKVTVRNAETDMDNIDEVESFNADCLVEVKCLNFDSGLADYTVSGDAVEVRKFIDYVTSGEYLAEDESLEDGQVLWFN